MIILLTILYTPRFGERGPHVHHDWNHLCVFHVVVRISIRGLDHVHVVVSVRHPCQRNINSATQRFWGAGVVVSLIIYLDLRSVRLLKIYRPVSIYPCSRTRKSTPAMCFSKPNAWLLWPRVLWTSDPKSSTKRTTMSGTWARTAGVHFGCFPWGGGYVYLVITQ